MASRGLDGRLRLLEGFLDLDVAMEPMDESDPDSPVVPDDEIGDPVLCLEGLEGSIEIVPSELDPEEDLEASSGEDSEDLEEPEEFAGGDSSSSDSDEFPSDEVEGNLETSVEAPLVVAPSVPILTMVPSSLSAQDPYAVALGDAALPGNPVQAPATADPQQSMDNSVPASRSVDLEEVIALRREVEYLRSNLRPRDSIYGT